MGPSTYGRAVCVPKGRAVRVPAVRFAQPAPRGAAGALQRAGILPVLPSAVATLPIKVEKLSMLCSSALDRVFPEASHAVCQARRAACRKALGSAPNEKDRGGEEMEARENFEPRGCWCVTKQRRWQQHGQIL